ncbi:unnamed protein product, partial [Musa banksii]
EGRIGGGAGTGQWRTLLRKHQSSSSQRSGDGEVLLLHVGGPVGVVLVAHHIPSRMQLPTVKQVTCWAENYTNSPSVHIIPWIERRTISP